LFFLLCFVVSLSVVNGQENACGLEIINIEFSLDSENQVSIRAEVHSNNIEAEGVAYLVNNIDLQSLGLDIFWQPASFSVSPNEIFQIFISGTSSSVITLPDDLELSGRIAFSFDEEPIIFNDIKLLGADSVLVDINNTFLDDDDTTIIILDTSVVTIDTILTPIDTLLTPTDTIRTELDSLTLSMDSLIIVDDYDMLTEDSVLLSHSTIVNDSILIGNQLIFLNDIPNLCEISYICQLPIITDQILGDEARIASDEDIQKNGNEIVDAHFGSIFDDGFLEMKEISFNVFPNPTMEHFYVHSTSEKNVNLLIYTTTGNIVFEKTMDSNYTKVDIPNLPDGLYFVLLKTNTGESHLTKLLVK